MMLRLTGIVAQLDEEDAIFGKEDALRMKAARALGLPAGSIGSAKLLRRSVDARKKPKFNLTLAVEVPGLKAEEAKNLKLTRGVSASEHTPPKRSEARDLSFLLDSEQALRPVVVGTGPAGLFCALRLAEAGLRPIVLERGSSIATRCEKVASFANGGELDSQTNVQFGEGGAGTFSDGKLATGIKGALVREVLEQFVAAGAPEDILVDAKPHIGTDLLPDVVSNLRKRIERLGGEVHFDTQLTKILTREVGGMHSLEKIQAKDLESGETCLIPTRHLILAIGHSARDTFRMLQEEGIAMERKPFAVGVRIEHLQDDVNACQYGKHSASPLLGASDYSAAVKTDDGRGVYTFCMCPGGSVVAASSEEGGICTNGMSEHDRDGAYANSAILVEVHPDDLPGDDPLEGVHMQRKMESTAYQAGLAASGREYAAPAQTVGSYLRGAPPSQSSKIVPTYPRGIAWVDLHDVLPEFVGKALAEGIPKISKRLSFMGDEEAVLTAPEARSSSPVRLVRDKESLESVSCAGLYPAGEGAGYAGGITSAAVDGIRCADALIESLSRSLSEYEKGA